VLFDVDLLERRAEIRLLRTDIVWAMSIFGVVGCELVV